MVLYDNYLVWSGLNQYDIIPLYQYLCLSLTDKVIIILFFIILIILIDIIIILITFTISII